MKSILRTFFLCVTLMMSIGICAQTLTNYAKQRQKEIAEMQRVEKINYEKACKKSSIDAYQEYLKMYPKGMFVSDIKNRIADFDFWNKTKKSNTIEGYNEYIRISIFKSYKNQANEAIKELQSVDVWNKTKGSDNISDIEGFKQMYPNSSCISDANKRIHELKAVNYYKSGNYNSAYTEFNEAGGKNFIDVANRDYYDKCLEYYDYSMLNNYSREIELQSFLTKHPNSAKYNEVSNKLAIIKAKALTIFSSDYSFNNALEFAKDEYTRNVVKSYIDYSKDSYRKYKREQRKSKIMANGGYVLFGWELIDFGWNGISPNRFLDVGYYNMGASVKFGNYRSPVQFEIGVKPGVIFYNFADDYEASFDEYEKKFHMPVYAKLKINICNWDSSKLYLSGLGWYNAIRDESLENEYSVGGGVGVAWRHWDWLVLYYKQDLNNKFKIDDKFISSSLVYYF